MGGWLENQESTSLKDKINMNKGNLSIYLTFVIQIFKYFDYFSICTNINLNERGHESCMYSDKKIYKNDRKFS